MRCFFLHHLLVSFSLCYAHVIASCYLLVIVCILLTTYVGVCVMCDIHRLFLMKWAPLWLDRESREKTKRDGGGSRLTVADISTFVQEEHTPITFVTARPPPGHENGRQAIIIRTTRILGGKRCYVTERWTQTNGLLRYWRGLSSCAIGMSGPPQKIYKSHQNCVSSCFFFHAPALSKWECMVIDHEVVGDVYKISQP